MLRNEALQSLAQLNFQRLKHEALHALNDSYPRTRVLAIQLLRNEKDAVLPIAKLARHDPWPMVRASAMNALAEHKAALPLLQKGLSDPYTEVRLEAVHALRKSKAMVAWPKIRERLLSDDEDLSVRLACVDFVFGLCITQASDLLIDLTKQGMRPSASEHAKTLSWAALQAAWHLGSISPETAAKLDLTKHALQLLRASTPTGCSQAKGEN
ncbi:MAG: HEAT repeat domain-containing protein [Myxococcales bacterium]|nr:MAG: HEAT repeat domain-containing protein [Myxococcales bacterium]